MRAHGEASAIIRRQPDLGRVPDRAIADRLGVSRALVAAVRRKVGRARTSGRRDPLYLDALRAFLSTRPRTAEDVAAFATRPEVDAHADTVRRHVRTLGYRYDHRTGLYRQGGPAAAPRPLSDDEVALLGTASDAEVARKVGRSKNVIAKARTLRGITPCHGGGRPAIDLPADVLDDLGKVRDGALADRAGVSITTIRRARIARGIPHVGFEPTTLPRDVFERHPGATDEEIARACGVARSTVQRARRVYGVAARRYRTVPPEALDLLGTDTDRAIAERFGVTWGAIKSARVRAGIPGFLAPNGAGRR